MNLPLPGYIDPEAWAGFVEMRKASGRTRPFTTRAATLILFELQRLKDAGHDPNAALDQSTRMGWADVYAPKAKDIQRAATAGTGELEKLRDAESAPRRGPTAEEAEKMRALRQRLRSVG
jgi:hypothetical protein